MYMYVFTHMYVCIYRYTYIHVVQTLDVFSGCCHSLHQLLEILFNDIVYI